MSRVTWSQGDWDLYSQPDEDAERHASLVREAIQRNLLDLVRDESITVGDGRRMVRVPLGALEEPRFRWRVEGAGQSVGPGQEADDPTDAACADDHRGGDQEGMEDLVEAEVSLDDCDAAIFEGLVLPAWDPSRRALGIPGPNESLQWSRRGLAPNLARRETLQRALLHRTSGQVWTLLPDDRRYRTAATGGTVEAGAVLLAMMDTSGSMGAFEKCMARSFFFWTLRFLRTRYPEVAVVFLAHDVQAREVDEETFFHRGASGGTVSSSVYRLADALLAARFPAERFNAYAFHFTDGGNLTSDNDEALGAGLALANRVNLFGYGEIHDTARNPSALYRGFESGGRSRAVVVRHRSDVLTAMRAFFRDGSGEGRP